MYTLWKMMQQLHLDHSPLWLSHLTTFLISQTEEGFCETKKLNLLLQLLFKCVSIFIISILSNLSSTGTVKHWKWCTWHWKASAKNSSKLNVFLHSEVNQLIQHISDLPFSQIVWMWVVGFSSSLLTINYNG